MALIIRLLGALQVNGVTTVYTVPSSVAGAVVSNIRLANAGGSAGTVNLFFNPGGGGGIHIFDKDKAVAANDIWVVTTELTLAPGDAITASTSVAMDCVVSGAEKL